MSHQIEDRLQIIAEKVAALSKQKAAMVRENKALRASLEQAKEAAQTAAANADTLQTQLDSIKYSQAQMQPEEKKAFEKRINGYIKEIDRCIALLSV